jgi:DNA-binding MarR family transcriptional regulator
MARAEIRANLGEDRDEAGDGALRELVGYNLKRAYLVLSSDAQAVLGELGLRILSFSCLSVITRNPGIAPSALAERLKMERSNLVVVIDELETRELVSRTQSKTDRRRFALNATVRGRRLHDTAVEALHRSEARLLARLSREEQALLVSMMRRIEAAGED